LIFAIKIVLIITLSPVVIRVRTSGELQPVMAVGDIAVYAAAEDGVLVDVGGVGAVAGFNVGARWVVAAGVGGVVGLRRFGRAGENIIDICHKNSINYNTFSCGNSWKGSGLL
jgi:hypothetical protein